MIPKRMKVRLFQLTRPGARVNAWLCPSCNRAEIFENLRSGDPQPIEFARHQASQSRFVTWPRRSSLRVEQVTRATQVESLSAPDGASLPGMRRCMPLHQIGGSQSISIEKK